VAALLPLAALLFYAAVPLSRVLTAPQYRDPPAPS